MQYHILYNLDVSRFKSAINKYLNTKITESIIPQNSYAFYMEENHKLHSNVSNNINSIYVTLLTI